MSGDDVPDRHTDFFFQAFVAGDGKAMSVQTKLVQQGGVNVGNIVPMFDSVKAEFVGRAVCDSAFDPAPSLHTVKPYG